MEAFAATFLWTAPSTANINSQECLSISVSEENSLPLPDSIPGPWMQFWPWPGRARYELDCAFLFQSCQKQVRRNSTASSLLQSSSVHGQPLFIDYVHPLSRPDRVHQPWPYPFQFHVAQSQSPLYLIYCASWSLPRHHDFLTSRAASLQRRASTPPQQTNVHLPRSDSLPRGAGFSTVFIVPDHLV